MDVRALTVLVVLILSAGCNTPVPKPKAEKDLLNFVLPEDVQEVAPHMQQQLYRLAGYNSVRYPVKPKFVFLDMDDLTEGRLDTNISRLNLLHLAWYKEGRHLWSGSLMVSPDQGEGVMAASLKGYIVGVKAESEQYRLTFQDGDWQAEAVFPKDSDHQQWLEEGAGKLYMNYYVFPKSLVYPQRQEPGRSDQ